MNVSLVGKTALVSGASGGIGSACARSLSELGAAVVIHYNSGKQSAEALVAELTGKGANAIAVQGDLTDPAAAAAVVAATVQAFGKVDILVNNSGYITRASLAELTPDALRHEFAINTFAPVYLSQSCLPYFPREGGSVVNISSNLAISPMAGALAYSAAKAALNALTIGMFKELGQRGIRVNSVAPGPTRTGMSADMSAEAKQSIAECTPLGRFGEPEDIADVVAFLASPAARWITGEVITVDGGFTAGAFGA